MLFTTLTASRCQRLLPARTRACVRAGKLDPDTFVMPVSRSPEAIFRLRDAAQTASHDVILVLRLRCMTIYHAHPFLLVLILGFLHVA